MKLGTYYDALELRREEKILVARFLKPHRVLSTCRYNGGLREDLDHLYNHQSCEPSNHLGADLHVAARDPERYQKRIASKAGIPFDKAASLGTAANMNNAAIAHASHQGFEVIAVTTAGVGSNGGRAGDPASYWQSHDGIVSLGAPTPRAGTINTLLFLSQELSPGALVVAATLLAEAKASVLQELCAPSRYSDGIATGTGTDQIGIACLLGTSIRHVDANKHSKAGELIGRAARAALQQALNLQSGMTPDSRRSCLAHLQRFGETQASFIESVRRHLDPDTQALFESNILSIDHDPLTVAATQACIHLRDQVAWGVLPRSCASEILLGQAAQIACAVSGKPIPREEWQRALGEFPGDFDNAAFLELIRRAFAQGFARKWAGRFED